MKRSHTRILGGVAILVVGGFAALFAIAHGGEQIPSITTPARLAADPAAIERGRYLATASDCVACHTASGGQPFAGGLALASPIGQIYSSNITPDKTTGIGDYTLDDFDRALRHGIARNGDTLYPAMPYPSYARMTPDDIADLYAYFLKGVQPVDQPDHATAIHWPLSIRWPLALWRKAFAPVAAAAAPDPSHYASAEIARGAYLVEGPGHCGTCHTPRAITLQEKALDDSSPLYLAGGPVIDGWLAVNLRGNTADGLGNWSAQDIASLLKTARNTHHAVVGSPMNEVVDKSLQHMSDADLQAVAAYLKTLPATPDSPSSYAANGETAAALRAGHESGRGAEIYLDNCAACHSSSGLGRDHAFPSMAGNSSMLSPDPTSMIRLVLQGSTLPSTASAPSSLGMPGFAWRLSDDETAQLLTFVRGSWGNHAPAVDASAVRKIRETLAHD
jgi:alcohol dehydrogenase (quinone), cytochrome c subunit